MTRAVFSTELFNARVETQIQTFFDMMNNLYGQRGWHPDPPRRRDLKWENEDFTVEVTSRYRDGAYKRIRFTIRNLPGYFRCPGTLTDPNSIRYEHRFAFDLPREYPQNIGSIRPSAETPLYHPRLSAGGKGLACYSVRGELDRILEDLPFFVLLKPDRVEPPSQFASDHGLNTQAMYWYERNTDGIVSTLERLWESRHREHSGSDGERRSGRVQIIDQSQAPPTGSRSPRILDAPERQPGRVRILDDEE
ncbi:MAG: hypothetical protein ACFFCO_04690 [Promethearchaeota archaeon]